MKMKQNLFVLPVLGLLLMLCQGCSEDKEENPPAPESPSITVESGEDMPVFETAGGTAALTFTATSDWTASVDGAASGWLSVSPASGGAGTYTLSLVTTANDSYDERNASVTITSGSVKKTFTVTQKQKDALILTSNKVEVDAEGGDFSIELQANVEVAYEIEDGAQTWLAPVSRSRALASSALTFHAEANEESESRQGVIKLAGGNGLTEEVTVYQIGTGPALVLSQSEYIVSSAGETIQVELRSNTEYEIEMPAVDWLRENSSRSLSTYTHYFTVDPNETYDAREAVIRFVDRENGLEQTVTVAQMQRDAIVVAQDTYEVRTIGDMLEFPVQANVDFTVETDVDWIRLREEEDATKGLTERILTFVIATYMQPGDREGHIILNSGTGITQTIRVIQKGTIAYIKIVSGNDTIVDCGANSTGMTVELGYANSFKISTPDWILENSSHHSGETDTGYIQQFIFNIKPNENAESRTGIIRIYDDEYGVSDEMKVTQEGNNQSQTEGGIDDMPVQPW